MAKHPVLVELEKCLWSTRLIGEVPEQEDDGDPALQPSMK